MALALSSTRMGPHPDSYSRREIERRLAGELNRAWELLRIVEVEYARRTRTGSSAQFLDRLLLPKELRSDWIEAQQVYQRALDRWLAFVKHGVIPEHPNSIQ